MAERCRHDRPGGKEASEGSWMILLGSRAHRGLPGSRGSAKETSAAHVQWRAVVELASTAQVLRHLANTWSRLKHGFRSGSRSRSPAICLPASGCGEGLAAAIDLAHVAVCGDHLLDGLMGVVEAKGKMVSAHQAFDILTIRTVARSAHSVLPVRCPPAGRHPPSPIRATPSAPTRGRSHTATPSRSGAQRHGLRPDATPNLGVK